MRHQRSCQGARMWRPCLLSGCCWQAGEGGFHIIAHDGKFLHDDGEKLKLHSSGDSKWFITPVR